MKQPVYFISHGGGPWPWMPEVQQANQALAASLAAIPAQLPCPPRAILMVSAHWETAPHLAIMGAAQPDMLYDYYGFPANTYSVKYAAPGDPALAHDLREVLSTAQFSVEIDTDRGFDHGAFVPAFIMYPDAQIPMLQLSIHQHYDPAYHLAVGRALAGLRDQNILIIGSGLSYHNLRQLGPSGREPSARFDAWLQDTLLEHTGQERSARLQAWATAPAARIAHPREDHLIPLMVAVGAAENEAATCIYHETSAFGGITASSFRLG